MIATLIGRAAEIPPIVVRMKQIQTSFYFQVFFFLNKRIGLTRKRRTCDVKKLALKYFCCKKPAANFIKKFSYSRYYSEACNEWRDPSPRLSAWTAQLRKNIAAVASRWRHNVRFDRPGKRTHGFHADSDWFNHRW